MTVATQTDPPSVAGRRPVFGLGTVVLVLVTAAGIGVRIALWWQDRAFWRDELALVQSLDAYGTRQLLGPLSDAQSAPPGWLLLIRATSAILGDGERMYRLLPLAAGCATLVLVALLAARITKNHWAAAVPVAVLATVSELVFYTAQTKQYTADTFLVTGLLLLAVLLLQTRKAELAWYVAIAIAPWFSHGAMLSIPLLATWVAVVQLRRRQRSLVQLAVRLALPAASVLAAALWSWRLTSQVSDFASYWDQFLGPAAPGAWWDWTAFVFTEFALRELGARIWWVGLILVAAGLALAVKRSAATGVLLVLPTAAAYVAGLLGGYPFGHRLILFCAPGLAVCLAVLVDEAIERAGRRRLVQAVAGVAATAVVLGFAWTTPQRLRHDLTYQFGVDDYRGALAYVAARWKPSDLLIVGNGDRAAVRVYWPRLHLPLERALRASPTGDTTPRRDCPLPPTVAEASRIWLVTGDAVPIYSGVTSRTALVGPLVQQFRVVDSRVKGLVTVQALVPGKHPKQWSARCLSYEPVGPAGTP